MTDRADQVHVLHDHGSMAAREWGRRQAEQSPAWPEAKWRRVGSILGVDFPQVEQSAEAA